MICPLGVTTSAVGKTSIYALPPRHVSDSVNPGLPRSLGRSISVVTSGVPRWKRRPRNIEDGCKLPMMVKKSSLLFDFELTRIQIRKYVWSRSFYFDQTRTDGSVSDAYCRWQFVNVEHCTPHFARISITQAISPVEKSLTIIPLVPRSESCSLRYGVRCILSFLADSHNTSIIVGKNMIGKRLEILWNEAFLKVCGNKNWMSKWQV